MGLIDDGTTEYEFIRLEGQINRLGQRVQNITPAGIDGESFRLLGDGSNPFQMVGTVDLDDAAALDTRKDALRALQGELVTVTDDRGLTESNVMVLEAAPVDERDIVGAVGGLSTSMGVLLTMRFTFQSTNVP